MDTFEQAKHYFNEGITQALAADALTSLPMSMAEVTHHERAIQHYDKAIAISSGHVIFWNAKAYSLRALGQVHDALGVLETAIEIEPKFLENYYQAALCFFELYMLDEAMSDYETATKLNDDSEVLNDRLCQDLHGIITKSLFYQLEIEKMGRSPESDELGVKLVRLAEFSASLFPLSDTISNDLDLVKKRIHTTGAIQ